jgi:hypothetical protein
MQVAVFGVEMYSLHIRSVNGSKTGLPCTLWVHVAGTTSTSEGKGPGGCLLAVLMQWGLLLEP